MLPDHTQARWVDRQGSWDLLIGVVAGAIFAQTISFGWVYDDQMEVVLNTFVYALQSIPRIFSSTTWAGSGMETYLYRPLPAVTFALNYQVSGLDPWSYHLVNVLLHAGCSVLVFRIGLLWRLPMAVAGVGGLLFALHPAHVEVVAGVFGRKDLLATLFTLATVLGHRAGVGRGGWRLSLPVAAFAAAIFSKEVALVALPFLVIHDWFLEPDRRRFFGNRRVPSLYIAYLAVFLAYVIIRNQVTGGFGIPGTSSLDNPLVGVATLTRTASALVVLARGILLLAVPTVLSPDYSFDAIPLVETGGDPRFWGALFLLGSIAVAVVSGKKRGGVLSLAVAWYFLSILPTSNLILVVGTIFGERLLYLPSVAFCILVGLGLYHLYRRSPGTAATLLVCLLVFLGAQTIRYSKAWESDLSLFSWAATQVPNSTKVHHKLGEEQLRAGQLGNAVRSLRRSLEISPENEFAAITLSQASQIIGNRYLPDRSPPPSDPDVLFVLAQIKRGQGDLDGAVSFLEEVVRRDPHHAEALGDLGTIWILRADTTRGTGYLEEAVRSKPTLARPWLNLGRVYLARREFQAAKEALEGFLATSGVGLRDEVQWAREVLASLGS